MKKYILIGVLSGMILGANSASAQRWRYDDEHYYSRRHFYAERYAEEIKAEEKKAEDKQKVSEKESGKDATDYHCYFAWKKDLKREKKEFKAREAYYDGRPESADRKLYKADKKEWKSKMKEHEHEHGWDGHNNEYVREAYYRRW